MAEDPVVVAERHVRSGEARVARQITLIAELEKNSHPQEVAQARDLLAVLQRNLELAHEHLRIEQDLRQRVNESGRK
jgi:hypothetical protein